MSKKIQGAHKVSIHFHVADLLQQNKHYIWIHGCNTVQHVHLHCQHTVAVTLWLCRTCPVKFEGILASMPLVFALSAHSNVAPC